MMDMMEMSTLFAGAIAVSVAVIAVVQVATCVYGARVARRVDRLADRIEQEIQPALTRVSTASGDVARVTSLAVAQLERVDHLFARLAGRLDHIMNAGEGAVVEPVRRSLALLHGLRAAIVALREPGRGTPKQRAESRDDDQEALFIG